MLSQKDENILQQLIKKDERTLRLFYKEQKKPLLNFILRHVSDKPDAEEVLQDAFLAFIEGIRDFRRQSSLKTFLFAIAKNKAIDKLRKKRLKRILFSHLPERIVDSIAAVFLEEELNRDHLSQQIERVMAVLPHDYATILRLKYKEDYKVARISSELKLSFKATESLLFRARQAFIVAYKTYE